MVMAVGGVDGDGNRWCGVLTVREIHKIWAKSSVKYTLMVVHRGDVTWGGEGGGGGGGGAAVLKVKKIELGKSQIFWIVDLTRGVHSLISKFGKLLYGPSCTHITYKF